MRAVNNITHGEHQLTVNKMDVSRWCKAVRDNNYQITSDEQDFSKSSQNARKFFDAEQKRMREACRNGKKAGEVKSVSHVVE